MRTDLSVLALAVVLIVGGVGVLLAGPALGVGGDAGVEETEIASSQTLGPYCTDERPTNSTTALSPLPGGERMRINDTIAVDRAGTTLEPSLRQFGPDRYVLDIARHPSGAATECESFLRYDVRLNLSTATGYTVVLTYDDRLVGSYWSEPGASGASKSSGGSRPAGADEGPPAREDTVENGGPAAGAGDTA